MLLTDRLLRALKSNPVPAVLAGSILYDAVRAELDEHLCWPTPRIDSFLLAGVRVRKTTLLPPDCAAFLTREGLIKAFYWLDGRLCPFQLPLVMAFPIVGEVV